MPDRREKLMGSFPVAAGTRLVDAVAQVIEGPAGEIENGRDLAEFLGRVRYRPGWSLRAEYAGAVDRARVRVSAWVHDSCYEGDVDRLFEVVGGPDEFDLDGDGLEYFRRGAIVSRPKPRIRCHIPAVQIHASIDVVLPTKADELIARLRECLGYMELHERDEWLRVDGEMPFNPHADEGGRG